MAGNIVKFVVVLGVVSLAIGGGVAALYGLFADEIGRRDVVQTADRIRDVCPEGTTPDLEHPVTGRPLVPGEDLDQEAVFPAKDPGGETVAYVAMGAAQGYSSTVKVAVGVRADDLSIVRVAVLAQQETPGLGANVAEKTSNYTLWEKLFGPAEEGKTEQLVNPFLDQFRGNTERQVPDVQGITAATLTSNAVKNAVAQAIDRIRKAVGPGGGEGTAKR